MRLAIFIRMDCSFEMRHFSPAPVPRARTCPLRTLRLAGLSAPASGPVHDPGRFRPAGHAALCPNLALAWLLWLPAARWPLRQVVDLYPTPSLPLLLLLLLSLLLLRGASKLWPSRRLCSMRLIACSLPCRPCSGVLGDTAGDAGRELSPPFSRCWRTAS